MSEAWIYREPPSSRSRHPPTEFARLPQAPVHPHAYSPTAHLERLGARPPLAPPAEAPVPAPPPFGSAYRPQPVVRQPLPTFGEAALGIALGMLLALVVLGAFAAVHFRVI